MRVSCFGENEEERWWMSTLLSPMRTLDWGSKRWLDEAKDAELYVTEKERNRQNVEILNYGLQYKVAPSYFVGENAKELHKEQCVVEPVLFYPWDQASNPSYCFVLF